MDTIVHDVLIIGAGPAGLAVAARLREPTPSAVFSDAEHNRYQWIKKHSGRMNLYPRKGDTQTSSCTSTSRRKATKTNKTALDNPEIDIKVLDSSGTKWMNSWRNNFAAMGISHLRSPMFFHPCPRDRDGLLAFAQETGRCDDCVEISGCVGKSLSKHRRKKKLAKGHSVGSSAKAVLEIDERDRKDYFTPSAEIFQDYCDQVVQRYGLEDLIEQAQVTSIDFGYPDEFDLVTNNSMWRKIFRIITSTGSIRFAKVVVLAVGSGGSPIMPRQLLTAEKEGACHTSQLPAQAFLASNVRRKILAREPTNVVIVGGGLTSAQIANKCLQAGVTRVFMIMRSELKRKPFNVDLEWIAKYKNYEKAAFFSADSDEGKSSAISRQIESHPDFVSERLEMLRKARGGGSITSHYFKKLQAHMAQGALSIYARTTIEDQAWNTERKAWNIQTEPPILDLPCAIDYIYYATGSETDVDSLPFLLPLREKYPVDVVEGLPCLTNDLLWTKDVPLLVTGRLAGLRVGPDCETLQGARVGAERISWALNEILGRQDSCQDLGQEVVSANIYESLEDKYSEI